MPSSSRPSMADVAQRSGCSQMTVSRALRNDPSVSAATREKIRRLAAQMGYRPNPMVSALMAQLRTGRHPSNLPGIVFATSHPLKNQALENPLMALAFRGAKKRGEELGYRVEPFWLTEPGLTASAVTRILRTRAVAGLIVAPLPEPAPILPVEWQHFACASLGFSLKEPALDRATNDQYATIRLACSTLRQRGFRRIGLALRAEDDDRVDHKWFAGYAAFQRCHPGLPALAPLLTADWSEAGFFRWLRAERPDAVVTLHPVVETWLRASRAARTRALPVTFLDRESVGRARQGVDQNAILVGAAAADLVIEQINANRRGVPGTPKLVLIEGVWRDSGAPAA